MNTSMILLIVPILIVIFVLYTFINRKGDFEKRLTYHTPRYLPHQRQEYINGAERYFKKASIIIGLLTGLPLMIIFVFLLSQDVNDSLIIFLFTIFIILIECLCIYLMYRFFAKNIKKQQLLLEQMSDSDFELLLDIQKKSYPFKYFPPFILCKDRLYFFGFVVQEINPESIKKVSFTYARGGNILVRIKSTTSTTISLYRNIYPILVEIIKKYSPDAQIES
ncbi:hypothetical protein CGC50_07330 [Capnocytophaga gingivalis]|uniref:Uncharacterized protein n=2 Tax=Capnocytophaga gingivalis TaxID=1017 RepID=A0A250FPQ4_9FLAO|nr:hypothetical protein CGC50_07330 [Capnocytophaga gingivalis]